MSEPSKALHRELRLLDAVGIGFGAIIGAGIFVVTGVAAGIAGPALLVGLTLAGIVATANALTSAQLAASFPRAGGTYEYGYELLHPLAGFAAGWMFLSSKIAAAGTVAIGLAAYLHVIVPDLTPRAIAVGAVAVFTVLNFFGIRRSSQVNLAIVVLSVGSLLLFVAATAPRFAAANLVPFAPAGIRGTFEAAAILFFAYTGYARIATLGEEVHEPERTIPRAVLITIGGALLLYAAVALTALGAAGAPLLARTGAPLRAAAEAIEMPWLATVVSVGGIAAMLGVILSQLLALSRMSFAMARRRDLPRRLGDVHQKSGVPRTAVLVVGALAMLVAATGALETVARTASFTILVYYGIANVAALRLPAESRLYPTAVPITGLLGCGALALAVEWRVSLLGIIVLLGGFLLRAGARRLQS